MKKKALSIVLTLCMVLTLLPSTAWATDGKNESFTVTGGVLNTDYTYENGVLTVLTGTPVSIKNTDSNTPTTDKIVVQFGVTANITISGVNINVSACAFDMTGATVNLTLVGSNVLKSGDNHAGLQVPEGATLTIDGNGSLAATGGWFGAGIGGGGSESDPGGNGGNVIIDGGTVTATCGSYGAGIGGGGSFVGNGGNGGTVTIKGGTVGASSYRGAGIGGGGSGDSDNGGDGGIVTIDGGTVTASGSYGAGIGGGGSESGTGGNGGIVTIDGGTVTASGSYGEGFGNIGAGIGGGGSMRGNGSNGGEVTINGGTVTASGSFGAGIGGGSGGSGGGGGIGGNGGTVIIDGGTVTASSECAAGIGGGNGGNGGTLTNSLNTAVVLYTFTLDGVASSTAVTELLATTALGYTYGTNDMKTDAYGVLCVYLPADKTAARITTADRTYTGSIANNAGALTALPLTAAQYAVASPAAASDTDYVVDDTNKTLTIKTAKGAAFWSGSGKTYLDYAVKLDSEIDVSAFLWTPVGVDDESPFTGTFDGQGHSIKGMTINVSSREAGLFAFASNAKIRNIGLIDSSITCAAQSGGAHAGGIVGWAVTSTVSTCYSTGNITASTDDISENYLGGIIGFANGISVSNCYSNSRISGTSNGGKTNSGGIVGFAFGSTSTVINCCYLTGSEMPDKGINAAPDALTATGCGTFTDNSGALTAGTADQFGGSEAQTLDYGTDLLTALKGWVAAQTKPNDYCTWKADSTPNVNGGYPLLDMAWTAPHAHCICGGTTNIGDHTNHSTVNYTPINNTDKFPGKKDTSNNFEINPGNYYLTEDITITKNLFIVGETSICLNGYKIIADSNINGIFQVNSTLNLCDCKGTGQLTGMGNDGSAVSISKSNTFNLYGGSITGNTVSSGVDNGCGTFTMYGGSITNNSGYGVIIGDAFTMCGGSITNNKNFGVFAQNNITLSGNVNISGNKAGDDSRNIVLMDDGNGTHFKISISGALTNEVPIGVAIVEVKENDEHNLVFTPKGGEFTCGDAVNNSLLVPKFISDSNSYSVVAEGSQLKLVSANTITKSSATNGSYTVKVGGKEVSSAAEGEAVTITPTADSGFELNAVAVYKTGDVNAKVAVSGNSFTMPAYGVTVSVTFRAKSTTPSGGGDITSTVTVPITGSDTTVKTDVTTSGSSVTVKEPTASNLDKVIAAAEKDKKPLEIDLSGLNNRLRDVILPANTLAAAGESAQNGGISGLTVVVPNGSRVTFDQTAAAAIAAAANGRTLTLSIDERALSQQTADETALLNGKTASNIFDLNLKDSSGRTVSAFEGGAATVVLKNIKMPGNLSDYMLFHKTGSKLTPQSYTRTATAVTDVFDLTIRTTGWSSYILTFSEGSNPFADVENGSYYYDAVLCAVNKGITNGTTATAFEPDATCTRAQAVTFLWRAMGSPEPTATVNPFTDISKDEYYYKAVLWAAEKGITIGTSSTTFSPNDTVTRGQTVAFLWRTAGKPASAATNPFADVSRDDYYANAVLWAVSKGITSGTSTTTFSPIKDCTRAQIVTFLYRYLSK